MPPSDSVSSLRPECGCEKPQASAKNDTPEFHAFPARQARGRRDRAGWEQGASTGLQDSKPQPRDRRSPCVVGASAQATPLKAIRHSGRLQPPDDAGSRPETGCSLPADGEGPSASAPQQASLSLICVRFGSIVLEHVSFITRNVNPKTATEDQRPCNPRRLVMQ
jgi:hypothetical protein